MNAEQDLLVAKIRSHIRTVGLKDYRRHALKHLKLKTVTKESHCSQVQALEFNRCDAANGNIFATVAKDQVTVYDDAHMADHIAVVAQLALTDRADQAKDVFQACCWINCSGLTRHPYGDALLAVAGADPYISIISIVEAAVVAQLPLSSSSSSVVDLSAAADHPGLLLVLCKDGTMQLWQVATGQCYFTTKSDAFTTVLHPRGDYIITSNRSGKLSKWPLQELKSAAAAAAAAAVGGGPADSSSSPAAAAAPAGVTKDPLLLAGAQDGSVVDCMRFIAGDRLAIKTADGRMAVYAMPSGDLISSWRVPGCGSATASYSSRCSFGHTQDGQYVAVGNHNTTAYVYETTTGLQVARVEAIRVQGSVRTCGLSDNCRHLLMVVGSGYIFRFEFTPAADSEEDEPECEVECEVEVPVRNGSAAAANTSADLQPVLQEPQQQQGQQQNGQQQQEQRAGNSSQQVSVLGVNHSPIMQQSMMLGQQGPGCIHDSTPAAGWLHDNGNEGLSMGVSGITPGSSYGVESEFGEQLKKPRLTDGTNVEASPLVFRPTPDKQ